MPRAKKAGQGKKGVNKMEAVRQVITKHGKHVLPAEIVKLVKEEHGAVLTMQMASTYKSAALRKLGLGVGGSAGVAGSQGRSLLLSALMPDEPARARSAWRTSKPSRNWWTRWGLRRSVNWRRSWLSEP